MERRDDGTVVGHEEGVCPCCGSDDVRLVVGRVLCDRLGIEH